MNLKSTTLGLLAFLLVSLVVGCGSTVQPASQPERLLSSPSDLNDPKLKDIALQLVSSAENSTLDWHDQYGYIEDIGDGRGYTGGVIGFCSGTGDMLAVVTRYTQNHPGNPLSTYLPALQQVNGTSSHDGLGRSFVGLWRQAGTDPDFQSAQDFVRDEQYFKPAVAQAQADGLDALGQFIYFDALVMHGPGDRHMSFGGIRREALRRSLPPAQGGDETLYLTAFLEARKAVMKLEAAHTDTSRIDGAQLRFLRDGNLKLQLPLTWEVYGRQFHIPS